VDVFTKSFHLYNSNYVRRLWTLQEAVLARSLIFQYKGGAQSSQELKEEAATFKSVREYYSTISNRWTWASDSIFDFYVFVTGPDVESSAESAFHPFANAIRSRSTKRAEDETLCFASILHLDVAHSLPYQMKAAWRSVWRNYSRIEMVGKLDSTIIFSEFPRLTTPGYK
jgi:hypothetical protein